MSDVTSAAPAAAAPVEPQNEAPAEAQQTSNEPPKKLSKQERRDQLVARLREGKERKQAERQAQQPAPQSSSEPTAEAKPDAEPAKDEKPAEKPKAEERDRDIELKVSRLARELKDAKADAIEFKPKAEKYDALTGKIEKAKGDPFAVVNMLPELFGMDFGQMAEFVIKNQDKFQESKKYADLPPDIREEVELARKERQERAEREKREAEQSKLAAKFTAYETKVKSFLEENADDYPLAAATGWAAGQIARQVVDTGDRDAHSMLVKLEESLKKEILGAVSNDRVLKKLIAGDKELRAKIASALGLANESNNRPASGASLQNGAPKSERNSGEGPATLTNRSTSSDTAAPTTGRKSRAERVQQLSEAFRAANFTRR